MSANPTAALLVIGDEILSGRTQDVNVQHLAKSLGAIGIDLAEVSIVPDDHSTIGDTARRLSKSHAYVFTSGGIGPTHDDITAEAIAAAFNTPISVRQDAREILEEHYKPRGIELNEARLRMARIPDGASLIDNPISAAPGFIIGNVHVMAGVPSIFKAMVEFVLPTLAGGSQQSGTSTRVLRGEGDIAEPLGTIAGDFPQVSIGSYPFFEDGRFGTNLVVRGTDEVAVEAASAELRRVFRQDIQQ